MAIIEPDNKIRKVELTGDEIQLVIDALMYQPHNVFEFVNYQKIVNKLKKAK